MLLILLVCIAWTSWLIFLALVPNKAANLLMDTSSYDNGQFWLFNDANPHLILAGAIGLVVVDICYLFVTLRMLLWRDKLFGSAFQSQPDNVDVSFSWMRSEGPLYQRLRHLWDDLTAFEGRNRKKWNAFLKLFDLAMETAMLRQLLQSGSPASLTYGFAGFLSLNALSCVVNVITDRFSALTEIFIDSVFDLCAAVLFPIVTLVYCYYNFDLDREVYLTYLEKLPPGSFEHLARSFADQSEIALFRVNFDSLRIDSLLDFALRISMNLTFCYRFERVLRAIVWTRHRELIIHRLRPAKITRASQNSVPKGISAGFVAICFAVLLSTHKAIADSKALCAPHPECVVYAHRWETNDEQCPCLILIDIDTEPKTYQEWLNPVDAYDKVKTLAGAGLLTSLQVINRQLLTWPDELRKCRDLKVIQMIYTSTQHIPSWTKELKCLETIQVEGKYGNPNLLGLPDNVFSDLPQLSMIHLGLHENIDRIPPLSGVPNLQSLSLAWITQLRTLPSFEHVPKLGRLILSLLPSMEQLPDMSPLQSLVEFVVLRPNHMCCNGFLGTCNLSHISCQSYPWSRTPAASCMMNHTNVSLPVTPYLGNTDTQKAFEKFAPLICQPSSFDSPDYLSFPTKETIEMCDGKPYRQCFLSGNRTGLCYNTRFQVLSCLADDNYIALRRLQIEKKVGPRCDPGEEKWLGCISG
ncbi:hypothetical protein PC129_g16644 [Phytophthora cactorum]|uniref:WLGC domain-containing protein n=1 Tax=Phytophthora cactorum TaxID=29920 RepID=A0A329SE70_9STRA|nr:hypothetical protein PC111_g15448 [Phytophthora cactorum]KAG2906887.1 hypothetical protein PC114_g10982 [Phytophthora cactorum]KAG2940032.1 hypothetical protein PC117_g10705 [Phytophthora cactorum]KAG3019348.1 hypothetical protein PC119_g10336 [Phytophthora cactorum]KAG3212393.1 hypothetical protein PC129_g16644 [Phytophthora cactorum]